MRNQRTARTALRSTRKATISDHESFLRTRKFEFDLELSVSTESPNPLAEVARFYRDAPIGSRIIHTTHWTALDVNRTECETGRGTPLLRRSRGRLSSTIVICYLVRLLKTPRRIPETHPFLLLAPQQAEVTTSLRTFSATCIAQKLGEMATPPIPDAAICPAMRNGQSPSQLAPPCFFVSARPLTWPRRRPQTQPHFLHGGFSPAVFLTVRSRCLVYYRTSPRQFTNAPNSSLQQLIELNKTMYPEAFAR